MDDQTPPDPAPDASTRTDDLDALLAKEGAYIPRGEPGPDPGAPGAGVGLNSAEACKTFLLLSFELIASRKGAHWKMNEEEATEAGKAYGALLDKYYPDIELGPEAAAVTVTAMIFLPRIAADKALAAEQAKKEAAEEAAQAAADTPDLDGETEEGATDAGQT